MRKAPIVETIGAGPQLISKSEIYAIRLEVVAKTTDNRDGVFVVLVVITVNRRVAGASIEDRKSVV